MTNSYKATNNRMLYGDIVKCGRGYREKWTYTGYYLTKYALTTRSSKYQNKVDLFGNYNENFQNTESRE